MRVAIACVLGAACSFHKLAATNDAAPEPADSNTCAAWLDRAWTARRTFAINSAAVTNTVTDLPVAIVLADDADLRARARADAADLRFVDSDGTTALASEIESYDSSTGTLLAWVRVPQLSSAAPDHVLYLYYGRVDPVASAGSVWLGYSSVWHFSDSRDSTGNGHGATGAVVAPGGQLGAALACDGATNQVDVGSYTRPATLGYEAWIDSNDTTAGVYHAVFQDWTANNRWFGTWGDEIDFYDGGTDDHYFAAQIPTHAWTYVAASYDGAMLRVYKNGALVGTPLAITYAAVTAPLQLGYNPSSQAINSERWNGALDELRVSDIVRSADFIATAYASEVDPASFAVAGALAHCP